MKKFFRVLGTLNHLTPHIISLLMVIAACTGSIDGTYSNFEFWAILGLSQVVSSVGSIHTSVDKVFTEIEESEDTDQQLNS
jgi:hypothetical protein